LTRVVTDQRLHDRDRTLLAVEDNRRSMFNRRAGLYVPLAEPGFEDPEFRVREDVLFEYGFPLTIVPTPEPSSALPLAWGLIAYVARRHLLNDSLGLRFGWIRREMVARMLG
jgi:hypothetical protein